MARSLASFGFTLASEEVVSHDLDTRATMLDYDIILFQPKIGDFIDRYCDEFEGKPCLSDTMSFKLREACDYWRHEIRQAIEAGKTVFVFLPAKMEVFVATGEKKYSGTGRNQQTTRVVAKTSNYSTLPINITVTNAAGSSIKLTEAGARWLAPYWAEFGSAAAYKVRFESSICYSAWLVTKEANIAVGGSIRTKTGGGLILLPDLDFEKPEFFSESNERIEWSDAARKFAARLVSSLIAVTKQWRAEAETTPEPAWATQSVYILPGEQRMQGELLEAEHLVEEARAKVDSLKDELARAGHLRALLFEKGKSLEGAIIQALELIGFRAQSYKDGASEFDVVFECERGRLLGEAEGKDTKAVNVDKLRQLAMNIHEDLQREDVLSPAKGVLFGNGFRLQPPAARGIQFTEKCISAAKIQSTALIATSDLFLTAQYLSENSDEDYKSLCREAVLNGIGLTALPAPPAVPVETPLQVIAEVSAQ